MWDDSPANPAAVTTETTTTGTATPAAASDGAAAETTTSGTATPTATTSPAPRISGEVPTPRSDEDPDSAVTTETTTTGTATPAAASDGAAAETTTSGTATPTATTSPAPRISGEVPTPRSDEDPDLPWWKRGRGKWGKYLDFQRLNVDQVPMPFICDMDSTLDFVGALRVSINQLSAALSKRQMTAQVCFRGVIPPPPPPEAPEDIKAKYRNNLMEQPPPCLIMRGTGTRISQKELDAYPPELVILWQQKAWADRPTSVDFVNKCYAKMIAADKAAGVADETSRYLMIADNLDSQDATRNPPYIAALDTLQTDDHKVACAPRPPHPTLSPLPTPPTPPPPTPPHPSPSPPHTHPVPSPPTHTPHTTGARWQDGPSAARG